MARHLPPLASVRVFEAAARHLNFTRAADELAMTQAAVSYQIRLIEERLGAALFVRIGRRVELSEAGEKLAPQVSAAFDLLDDAFAKVREDEGGVLVITAAPGIATNWLGPRLARFQLAFPDLAVRLTVSNDLVDFARDPSDVGVRIGVGAWPGLRAHRLFPARFTPMCSPAFLASHGPFDTPESLLDVLRLNSDERWWLEWFRQVGVALGDNSDRKTLLVDSQAIEGSAAIAGNGIAMLSPAFWQFELVSGRLIQLFDHVGEHESFWLVYPEHKHNVAKVRAFREWLLMEAAAEASPVVETPAIEPA